MYALPPRRRISLILVKLGPAHWFRLCDRVTITAALMLMVCLPPRDTPPLPGQRGHRTQRHTAAGTAAPATTDTGTTVPHRANE